MNACIFFFQAEDGIRDLTVTGVQTCALPISQVYRQALRVRGVNVSRPVQVQAVCIGIADAELIVVAELALDGEVGLLRVSVLEVAGDRQGKWQKGYREAGTEEVLIVKERAVLGVEALLVRQVSNAGNARRVQDSLEDRSAVRSRRVGAHLGPGRRAAEDKEL